MLITNNNFPVDSAEIIFATCSFDVHALTETEKRKLDIFSLRNTKKEKNTIVVNVVVLL